MIDTLFIVYTTIAALTALLVVAEYRRISSDTQPARTRLALAVVVGLLWPVLVVGVLELGSIAAMAKASQP